MHLETAQVIQRHLDALMARDLERILADYAEDATVMCNLAPDAICGTEALRQFWTQSLTLFTPEVLSTVTVGQLTVKGELGYLVWSAGAAIPFGTDTFVVRHGKIVLQTGTAQVGGPQ